MSKAQAGVGSVLARGNGATPEVFTKIAEIRRIGGPALGLKMVDVTNMDSPSATEELLATIVTSGEVAFEGNCLLGSNDATQLGCVTDLQGRIQRNFQYTLPTPPGGSAPSPWTFSGYFNKFETENPHDNAITFKASIKITGVVTIP